MDPLQRCNPIGLQSPLQQNKSWYRLATRPSANTRRAGQLCLAFATTYSCILKGQRSTAFIIGVLYIESLMFMESNRTKVMLLYGTVAIILLVSLLAKMSSAVTYLTTNGYPGSIQTNGTLLFRPRDGVVLNCTSNTGKLKWASSVTRPTSYSVIADRVWDQSGLVRTDNGETVFNTQLVSVDQNTLTSTLTAPNISLVSGVTVQCSDLNGDAKFVLLQQVDARPPSPTSTTASPSSPASTTASPSSPASTTASPSSPASTIPSFPYSNTSLVCMKLGLLTVPIPGINGTLVNSTLATVKGLNNMTYDIFMEEGCGPLNVSSSQDLCSCVGAQNISGSITMYMYYSDQDTSYVKTYDQCHSNITNITAVRITCPQHSSSLSQGMPTWQKVLIGVGMGAIGVRVMLAVLCASALCTKKGKLCINWLRSKAANRQRHYQVTQPVTDLELRVVQPVSIGTTLNEENIHSSETQDTGSALHVDKRPVPVEMLSIVPRMSSSPETRASSPPPRQHFRGLDAQLHVHVHTTTPGCSAEPNSQQSFNAYMQTSNKLAEQNN